MRSNFPSAPCPAETSKALARWLLHVGLLILVTVRGVDIGAKGEIYELIDKLARAGKPFW